MGEKGKVNTAVGILSFTGVLVVYSAIDRTFQVPPEIWGLASVAAGVLLTTARRDKGDDD